MRTPPSRRRRRLWIPGAIVVAVVLVAGTACGGYALGRLRLAERQPPAHAVSAGFVRFQLAPGWNVVAQTAAEVSLRNDSNGYMTVQVGNARQAGITSEAALLQRALYGMTQDHLRGGVGSCLPVTSVDIGGRAGEEVGFLFRAVESGGTSPVKSCELVWVDVQGSKFYDWDSSEPVSELSQLASATRAMQRTVFWSR